MMKTRIFVSNLFFGILLNQLGFSEIQNINLVYNFIDMRTVCLSKGRPFET